MWKKYRFDEFLFDGKSGELTRQGETLALSPKGAAILGALLDAAGELVSKQELLQEVWPDAVVGENSLRVRINEIRRVLGDLADHPRFVGTVPQKGYRFVAKVKDAIDRAPEPWERPSIAVLPFTAHGLDPELRGLADGVCTALIASLTRWGELPVVSLTLEGRRTRVPVDVRHTGAALDAAITIEGGVQREGARTRVSYEIAETKAGNRLAAGHFDFDESDALAIQDGAAGRISRVVPSAVRRSISEEHNAAGRERAWDLALRGQQALDRADPGATVEARTYFLDALDLDPFAAQIHGDLWVTHAADLGHGWVDDPEPSLAALTYHAERCVAIDRSYAGGHFGLAYANTYGGDLRAAHTHLDHAEELAPGLGMSVLRAKIHLRESRLEEAHAEAARAVELLVGSENADLAYKMYASTALALGDYEAALESAEKAAALWPTWVMHLVVATIHAACSRPDEARRTLERARELRPGLTLEDTRIAFRFDQPGANDRYQPLLACVGLR